jgi:DNA-directed RNA polymerase subunit RPC12/RpoP
LEKERIRLKRDKKGKMRPKLFNVDYGEVKIYKCSKCKKEFEAFRGSMSGFLKLCPKCIKKLWNKKKGNLLIKKMEESGLYGYYDIGYYKRLLGV